MPPPIAIHVRRVGPSTSEAEIRGHRLLIDRPTAKGGADAGPMGGELFLASVAGCFLSTLLAAIKTRGLAPSTIETEVVGTLAESPAHFSAIEIQVFAPDLPDLDKLLEIADRSCIMTNTLRGTLPVRIGIR